MGKVFVDYLSPLKRDRIKTKMLKKTRDEQPVNKRRCPLAFAGTPDFAAVALSRSGAGHTVPLVLTQPDRPAGRGMKRPSPVKQLALELGVTVAQPRSLRLDGKFPDEAEAGRAALDAARARRAWWWRPTA